MQKAWKISLLSREGLKHKRWLDRAEGSSWQVHLKSNFPGRTSSVSVCEAQNTPTKQRQIASSEN